MNLTDQDVFLDFETRSRADLKKVGAWRYAEDPSTKILCIAYALGNREPMIWIEGQQPPKLLMECIKRGYRIHGWNSLSFERAIFEVIAGPQLGWATPKLEQYHDTMSDALALALPARLDDCGIAVGASFLKDANGKKLIQKLCKPISAGKLKGQFRERDTHIKDYADLYSYCKQDVRSERDVFLRLPRHVEGVERQIMILTAVMNERGLFIDKNAVIKIAEAIEIEKDILCTEFAQITGVTSPTKRAEFLSWLQAKGLRIDNTQKETLRDIITMIDEKIIGKYVKWCEREGLTYGDTAQESFNNLPDVFKNAIDSKVVEVRRAIELAQSITRTANAKYKAILNSICLDGTVKNNLIYHKANTGRMAGAGFQVQNLAAEAEKEPDALINCFIDDDMFFVRLWRGVLETASALVRAMIKARPGKKFLNGDLKQVEMRGSAWSAREWDILAQLGQGIDPYKVTAARMYHILIEVIHKDSKERQAGKITLLAGGFGGAKMAVLSMARKMGIDISEKEAEEWIKDFRKGRKRLVDTWWAFGDAALEAMADPGVYKYPETKELGPDTRFKFIKKGQYLFLVLPNGRHLSFPFPEVRQEQFKGRSQSVVTAMWVDNYTKKWSRRVITGPSFFQSAVQALCRDLLMEAHLRVEAEGFPLMLSVHDEQQSEVPDDARYQVKEYERLMCIVPTWANRFPIAADCWEGYRFKK